MSKKLEEYSREELIEAVRQLKKRKKFGLVWEDKPEKVVQSCQENLPVLDEVKDKAIDITDGPTHLIIEGDNYHSLSALNYTHAGKIDLIYIDPPYNTGNKDFIYNDSYVDKEDTFRHSKWLSFMSKRLALAKSLLCDTGLIFISIDDAEQANLKLLCDQIFGSENFVTNVTVYSNPRGRQSSVNIAQTHEYVLIYQKSSASKINGDRLTDEQKREYSKVDNGRPYREIGLRKRGSDSRREDTPNLYFPIYFNSSTGHISLDSSGGDIELLPRLSDGSDGRWRWGREKVIKDADQLIVRPVNAKNGSSYDIFQKDYLTDDKRRKVKSLWDEKDINYDRAAEEIRALFTDKVFDYAKPLYLLKKIINMAAPEDGIVLDFMAGSGTTGQAVIELNKEDSCSRKFILCTNNENRIAEDITYQRIKRVIKGHGKVDAVPTNARYFKTEFVSKEKTDDQTRLALVDRCTDMIRIRENTFKQIVDEPKFKLFGDSDHYSAIIFDPQRIPEFIKKIEDNDKTKPVSLYIFSYSNYAYDEDIPETELDYSTCPIPESVLEVYKRIFEVEDHLNA